MKHLCKVSILCFFFIGADLIANSQVTKISNPSKLPSKTGRFKIIGKNNDGIVVRLYGSLDVINVYNSELKLETSKTISFKNQDGLLQHIMLNRNGAVIFYLQQDKKQSYLFAQPVGEKFTEVGKPIILDSIVDHKDLVASNLRFKNSVDQSYLLIYYPFFTYGKIESMKFICIDRSMNVVYNKTIPLNRQESEMDESKVLIDNTGNSFLILKPESPLNKGQYDVLHLNRQGDFSMFSVTPDKEIFGESYFDIDNKNGNLVMTAFFDLKQPGNDPAANGFMYSSFNPDSGILQKTNYTLFSKEFIAELTGRTNVTNQSLYTFSIKKSVLRNDGGSLIIAESFIKDTREQIVPLGFQPGYNSYRSSDIFQFNDIIAFSINPDGLMEWGAVMRKKQVSEDDNGAYSSFLTVNEKDRLRFLYLDDILSNSTLNEYVLGSDGKYERHILFNQEDKDVMLLPKLGKQISPNEIALPSYKENELRLLKITY